MRIPVGGVEVIDDLALIPDMVAGRENVNAHLEKIFGQGRGDAETGRCVLSIGKHEINSVLFYESRQAILDDGSSRPAKNVTDKKNAHGKYTESSMVTRGLGGALSFCGDGSVVTVKASVLQFSGSRNFQAGSTSVFVLACCAPSHFRCTRDRCKASPQTGLLGPLHRSACVRPGRIRRAPGR